MNLRTIIFALLILAGCFSTPHSESSNGPREVKIIPQGLAAQAIEPVEETSEEGPVAVLSQWPARGDVWINQWDISHDGSKIAALTEGGKLDVWDVDRSRLVSRTQLEFPGRWSPRRIDGLYWMADNRRVVLTLENKIGMWKVDVPETLWTDWSVHQWEEDGKWKSYNRNLGPVDRRRLQVNFHPHRDIIFTTVTADSPRGGVAGGLYVWNAGDGSPIWHETSAPLMPRPSRATVSPDGDTLWIPAGGFGAPSSVTVAHWPREEIESKEWPNLHLTNGDVAATIIERDISPRDDHDGLRLGNVRVILRDMEDGETLFESDWYHSGPGGSAFAPVTLRDVPSWAPRLNSVEFSPDHKAIYILAQNRFLSVDADTGMLLEELKVRGADFAGFRRGIPVGFPPETWLSTLRLSRDGTRLAGDFQNRHEVHGEWGQAPLPQHVEVWERDGTQVARQDLRQTPYPIQEISFSPDQTRLVARDDRSELFVWDIGERQLLHRLSRWSYDVTTQNHPPRRGGVYARFTDRDHLLITGLITKNFIGQRDASIIRVDVNSGRKIAGSAALSELRICNRSMGNNWVIDAALSSDRAKLFLTCGTWIHAFDADTFAHLWEFNSSEVGAHHHGPQLQLISNAHGEEELTLFVGDRLRDRTFDRVIIDRHLTRWRSFSAVILDAETGELKDSDPGIGAARNVSNTGEYFIRRDRLHSVHTGRMTEKMNAPRALGTKFLWTIEDDHLTARRLDTPNDIAWRTPLELGPSSPTVITPSPDGSIIAIGTDDGGVALFVPDFS